MILFNNFFLSIILGMYIIVPETHKRASGERLNKLKMERSSLDYVVTRVLIYSTGELSKLAHSKPELQAN